MLRVGMTDTHGLGLTAQLRRLQTEIAPVVAAELSFLAVCGDTFNVHGYRTAAAYTRHHIDIQCFVRDRRSWDKIFEPVLYVLPPDLAHLRVTTTRVDEMIPPALWCLIFGYFRTLETLELRGEAYFSFLATFDADPGPDTDADDGYYTDADANAVLAALFNASVGPPENLCTRWPPKIRTLTITRVNFAVARGHDERTIPRSFKALLRVVRMVHDGGMAMTELRFAQCRGLLSSHTQELAKFVPVISCEDSVDSTFGLHHEYDSGDNDLEDPHFWRE